MSALRTQGQRIVYHTYWPTHRLDVLWGMYSSSARAPKGRNEEGHLVAPPRDKEKLKGRLVLP